MKILYLGLVVGRELAPELSGISIAGNNMQLGFLEALSKLPDVEITTLTIYPVARFPKDKGFYFSKSVLKLTDRLDAVRIPFLNVYPIKQFWQVFSMYKEAKKYIKGADVVLTFNMFPQNGLPAVWLKKKYDKKLCSVLADLPVNDGLYSKSRFIRGFRKAFDRLTCNSIPQCDRLFVLNSEAAKRYAPQTPYVVMEGGIDAKNIPERIIDYRDKKSPTLLYTGALSEYSGVLSLIEAMKLVKNRDVVLEIYGRGKLEEQIKQEAANSANVRYCGYVSGDRARSLQCQAFALANPRPVDNPIAQVTFPSKIIEYMVSGSVVLTTKLNGLTDDYLERVFYVEDARAELLAAKIDEIFATPIEELNRKARDAYEFVRNNKTWDKQAVKIFDGLKQSVTAK